MSWRPFCKTGKNPRAAHMYVCHTAGGEGALLRCLLPQPPSPPGVEAVRKEPSAPLPPGVRATA